MTEIDPEAPYGRKKDGTPRKPRGFQKGGAQYRAPSGSDGTKLAGGQLWGWSDRSEKRRRLPKEEKTAMLENFFLDVVFEPANKKNPTPIMAKLHAAGRLHEIYNGKPTMRIAGGGEGEAPIQVNTDTVDGRNLSLEERQTLREILNRAARNED